MMQAETTALVCAHVFRNERSIKLVIHHDDGVWQLVCGELDHPSDCSDFKTVGLEHLIERQSNLGEIANLGRGRLAEWCDDKWICENFYED